MDKGGVIMTKRNTYRRYVFLFVIIRSSALVLFGRLVDQVEELVEFRCDDDFGSAVTLLAHFGIVVGDGVVLAAASGREARGIDAEVVLQALHHAAGTKCRKVPVVADVLTRDRHIVRIALHQHVVIGVVLDDLGDF